MWGVWGQKQVSALKVTALTLALGLSLPASAQTTPPASVSLPPMAEKEFDAGNALMQQNKYAEALPHYKNALTLDPNDSSLLYDAGLAAYLSHDYSEAAPYWTQLVQEVPVDWRVRAKLVQTYQALGDLKARDSARQAVLDLRKSRKVPDLNKQNEYCREQFEVNRQPVFSYELFDFKGEFATRYKFIIVDKAKGTENYHILLESDEADNEIAKETGELKPGQRIFSLDGYYFNASGNLQSQKLFGFFNSEPTYEETRAAVIKIVQGQTKPLAGLNKGSSQRK